MISSRRGAENFPPVVIHQTEPVAVIRRTEIIPDAIRNSVLNQQGNNIIHPVLPVFQFAMPDRPEFTAPEDLVRMSAHELECGLKSVPQICLIHPFKQSIITGFLTDCLPELPVFADSGRIFHTPVVKQRRSLKNTTLMREFKRRISMKRINNVPVVKQTKIFQCIRTVPAGAPDNDLPRRIELAQRPDRLPGESVPKFRIDVAYFVQQLKRNSRTVMEPPFKFHPERDETPFQFRIVQQRHRFRNIAIVADRLMQIQHNIQTVCFTPADKLRDPCENTVPVPVRRLLQYDLIKSEPDMIHAVRCNAGHIRFCDIGVKMLKIADRKLEFPLLRQHVEPLVIGQPSADPHPVRKTGEPLR